MLQQRKLKRLCRGAQSQLSRHTDMYLHGICDDPKPSTGQFISALRCKFRILQKLSCLVRPWQTWPFVFVPRIVGISTGPCPWLKPWSIPTSSKNQRCDGWSGTAEAVWNGRRSQQLNYKKLKSMGCSDRDMGCHEQFKFIDHSSLICRQRYWTSDESQLWLRDAALPPAVSLGGSLLRFCCRTCLIWIDLVGCPKESRMIRVMVIQKCSWFVSTIFPIDSLSDCKLAVGAKLCLSGGSTGSFHETKRLVEIFTELSSSGETDKDGTKALEEQTEVNHTTNSKTRLS